ncbi:MAG: serralysin [Hyphomicrobiales bacterium]|nr:serralysin [Hyphomicrobiales bacterium]
MVIENAIGGSGNDSIVGNSADNAIDGRAGDDTVVYAGPRSAYTVTDIGGGSVRVTGPDGNDTISNVERLVFSDTTVTLTPSPSPPASPISSSCKWSSRTEAADFNGDGKADILWQNDSGTPAVWLMDGVKILSTGAALINPGPSWHEKAAADFNGDGKADILWQNDSGTPAVWLMDGTSVLSTGPALSNPGTAWHII